MLKENLTFALISKPKNWEINKNYFQILIHVTFSVPENDCVGENFVSENIWKYPVKKKKKSIYSFNYFKLLFLYPLL